MRKSIWRYKRFWLFLLILTPLAYLLTLRPIQIILQTAPNKPRNVQAQPALPQFTIDNWQTQRADILAALESKLYGKFPDSLEITVTSKTQLPTPVDLPNARIDVWNIKVTNTKNSESADLDFILLNPLDNIDSKTIILSQNFCPNHNVVPYPEIPIPANLRFSCEGEGFFSKLMLHFFGRYIVSPPLHQLLDDGYAMGFLHPPQVVPDYAAGANQMLGSLFSEMSYETRPGALITWAALSAKIADHLSDTYPNIVAWGHSRYGKTALLAGAFSENIDGVVAHQSGTAGASLFRDKPGETLTDLVSQYPHWLGLNARYYVDKEHELPLDQHFLLAAIAPKPVLLGNARRDVWSDPEGAFRAAQAANKAYGIFKSEGMTAKRLGDFRPQDDVSFWIRPGTHGIVKEDWPAFLAFLDAHFPSK